MIHNFNILKGVSREKFADLKLRTECGKWLTLHKVVAASVSAKWSTLLSADSVSELSVRNVKFSALENLVNFIYDGKIVLGDDGEVQDFVDAYTLSQINLGDKVNDFINRLNTRAVNSDNKATSDDVETDFKCCNCNKTFDDKRRLTRHLREVHNKGKKKEKQLFACEQCGETYTVWCYVN